MITFSFLGAASPPGAVVEASTVACCAGSGVSEVEGIINKPNKPITIIRIDTKNSAL